jgi:hypothetical protein
MEITDWGCKAGGEVVEAHMNGSSKIVQSRHIQKEYEGIVLSREAGVGNKAVG